MIWRRIGFFAAFALPVLAYLASASPEPASWDTAELQGVPYILGISHPTGFPFYVLAGYVWSHAIAVSTVAWRMNALSGVAMALTCAAAYGVARQFKASWAVALGATLWFAFTANVWSHAARAESQDLATMCSALAIYAAIHWMRGGSDRWCIAAFAACGLGMAAHPNALWVLPGLLIATAIGRQSRSWQLITTALASCIAGLLLYAYLPLRSAYVVAHGLDPTAQLAGAGGGIFWNYNDPRTLSGLILELTGSESQTPAYFLASFNPLHIKDALGALLATLVAQFGIVAAVLIAVGTIVAWRRNWPATLVLLVATTAGLIFTVVYPNESDIGRYRFLASWLAVPLLGALTPQMRRPFGVAMHGALVLVLFTGATAAFARQVHFFYHGPHEGGRWIIDAVRPYVPRDGIIVTGWLDATSLAYGAYVDGSLPGRIVVSDDAWHVQRYRKWAQTHPVFVVVDPHSSPSLPGAQDFAKLDAYHDLFEVRP